MRANTHQRACKPRSKPGQKRHHEFREIETTDGIFLNKKKTTILIGEPPGYVIGSFHLVMFWKYFLDPILAEVGSN